MQFNIVVLSIFDCLQLKISYSYQISHFNNRQSEVIAEDSRRMRHIYIVKSGSLDVWKRLDPDGYVPKLTKYDYDQIKNEKSL